MPPGGVILALKGESAADEVAAAKPQLKAAQLEAEILTVQAHPRCGRPPPWYASASAGATARARRMLAADAVSKREPAPVDERHGRVTT